MLVQQAGPGALPLSNLVAQEFLPFFRRIEESVVFHGLSPVIVYWSTRDAKWLLPEANQFRTLTRDAVRVSIFSENNNDKQDEFCFLVHSQGISMVVYGHCSDESGPEKVFQCVGSIDPHIVKRAYQAMTSLWQYIDLPESNKLDDSKAQVGNPVTAPHFVSGIRNDWPVVKQRQAAGATPPPLPGIPFRGEGAIESLVPRPGASTDPLMTPSAAIGSNNAASLKHPQHVVRPGDTGEVILRPTNIPPPPPGPPIPKQVPPPSKPRPTGRTTLPPTGEIPKRGALLDSSAIDDLVGPSSKTSVSKPAVPASGSGFIEAPGNGGGGNGGTGNGGTGNSGTGNSGTGNGNGGSGKQVAHIADAEIGDNVFGDPSLLEEEFNFESITASGALQPPAGIEQDPRLAGLAPQDKKSSRNIQSKSLREVWTNITQEVRTVFAPDAQRIIKDIIGQLRISSDLPAILDLAVEELTKVSQSDRGLIWQVVDDQLVVTNEFAQNEHYCFKGANLGAQETTAIVSEFLSRFPDETGAGVIGIPDTLQDQKLRRMSPTLAALIELGDARARLVAQVRSRGIFHGFIELQQSGTPREWTDQDGAVLQSVSEVLSLVVQQSFDLMRIEQDANEMKIVNEIATIFRESAGQRAQKTIEQAIRLFADHTNFTLAQVYLFNEEEYMLVPQIAEKEYSESIPFAHKQNPFLQVFENGKLKTVNIEYSKRGDPFFGHDTAMIIPLISEGEKLGVMGLWRRKQGSPMLRPQDRELALTVAGNLASIIRAEQANAQIRQQWARETLINTVSEQIQQSLKEVNPILQTLVSELARHFELGLSSVAMWDSLEEKFTEAQCAGSLMTEENSLLLQHMAGNLFTAQLEALSHPDLLSQPMPALMLSSADLKSNMGDIEVEVPESMQLTMLFPLRQGSNLKGALCMVSALQKPPSLPDMRMIQDLLSRVAVVVEHKELFEKVERQAITDALTGLYNRRYFEEQLNKELDRHQRFGHACSFIILDLDHFKSVNDTLDHLNGDVALKHTAAIVKKCVRDVDTVGRFGGEEFVVLLPESDTNAALVVAERICQSIRESTIEKFKSPDCQEKIQAKLDEGKINHATAARLGSGKITASVGVATFPSDAQDKVRLLELADKYLFMAKGNGRNQVYNSKRAGAAGIPEEPKKEAAKAPLATPQPPVMPSMKPNGAGVAQRIENAITDLHMIAEHGILGMLGNVIKAVSSKDGYNDDRSPRAAEYASRIAQALRLSKDHTTVISLAAVLNNLGKVIVDEEVLRKSGPLTADEWKLIETAPMTAAKILEPAKHLHRVATVVESYHEHWDGSGYPRGLKGDDIPLESRIISVVDAYVAMTSDRPYRAALPSNQAVSILQQGAGKEWDPRIVKLFLALLDKEGKQA